MKSQVTQELGNARDSTPPDILVVDDNPANLDLLCKMLGQRGYRVRVASNGQRALAAAQALCPDLVMLDVTMPGMSGYEVCRQLKANPRTAGVPVIFISALDEVVDKVRAFEAGGVDYVTKPFEFGEVLARLDSQLNLARLQRQLELRNRELERTIEDLRRAQRREASAFDAMAEALPGTLLDGRYRLEEKIGRGGFGTVFRATQTSLERQVAVKVLQPLSFQDNESILARFLREGISACRVNHPNALAVIDAGMAGNGIAFLVTELLTGRNLAVEMRKNGRLPPRRVRDLAVPICSVLQAAHAQGVVHRDVKPANVFLHQAGGAETVKVLDFGIAKLLGDDASPAEVTSHQILGTPRYMAPERLRGEPHDGAVDVYSLGVMLYEMLSASHPLSEEVKVLMAWATRASSAEPRPLRELVPEVPFAIAELVSAALHHDPARRPSLADLEKGLASGLDGQLGEAATSLAPAS